MDAIESSVNDVFGKNLGKLLNTGLKAAANYLGLSDMDKKLIGYTGEIVITPISYTGTEICSYTLYNAFPTSISELSLKDSSISEIGTFSVDFSFSHMTYSKKGGLLENAVSVLTDGNSPVRKVLGDIIN